MKNETVQAVESGAVTAVHPLHKPYTLISTKHIDYNDLSAFEATAMTLALFMAVTIGLLQSMAIA